MAERPLVGDELPVPAAIVEGVTMNPDQRTLGTILERAAISIRSRRRSQGLGLVRFKTAS
jgi:hypothetical protein